MPRGQVPRSVVQVLGSVHVWRPGSSSQLRPHVVSIIGLSRRTTRQVEDALDGSRRSADGCFGCRVFFGPHLPRLFVGHSLAWVREAQKAPQS